MNWIETGRRLQADRRPATRSRCLKHQRLMQTSSYGMHYSLIFFSTHGKCQEAGFIHASSCHSRKERYHCWNCPSVPSNLISLLNLRSTLATSKFHPAACIQWDTWRPFVNTRRRRRRQDLYLKLTRLFPSTTPVTPQAEAIYGSDRDVIAIYCRCWIRFGWLSCGQQMTVERSYAGHRIALAMQYSRINTNHRDTYSQTIADHLISTIQAES